MRVSLAIRVGCGRQIARNQASRAGRAFRRNCELFQCSQASPTGGAGKHPRRGFLAGRPLRSFRRCLRASSNHSRFSISRCQTAIGSLLFILFEQQCSSFHITPNEGWMERRQAHSFFLLSRVRGATPALVRRGPSRCDRDPFRRSTVALSSCGPTLPFRQWDTGSGSDCPRQAMNAWRSGTEPPAVRFAPQPRDATPGSVFQDRF
jgi:hypothetical protein